jgi:hypothetical protein
MNITVLGEARHPSPLKRFVSDEERVPAKILRSPGVPPDDGGLFERAACEAVF